MERLFDVGRYEGYKFCRQGYDRYYIENGKIVGHTSERGRYTNRYIPRKIEKMGTPDSPVDYNNRKI